MSLFRRVVANRDNYEKVIDPTVAPSPLSGRPRPAIDHACTGQKLVQG